MLPALVLRGRIVTRIYTGNRVLSTRSYTNGRNGRSSEKGHSKTKDSPQTVTSGSKNGVPGNGTGNHEEPSLFEQLFPDQHEAYKKTQRDSEIPRLPIETEMPDRPTSSRDAAIERHTANMARPANRLWQKMRAQDEQTSVLVLRNASKNLLEEDFKRLIPQGKHLEGWTLERGDILQVIPGRDLNTLAQENFYFLLFSSPLSAFTYQGFATRIHRLVAEHTPSSMLSPIPPPPGYMIKGMDAHAAIESFSLIPPSISLDLRQLKPPLAPMMDSIVRHGGYPAIVNREDRMPFEARLTLEGPQLNISALRHILLSSGRDRALGWSGGNDLAPKLTKWEPKAPSPSKIEIGDSSSTDAYTSQSDEQKRRTAQLVYVAGFHTDSAMQSFVRYWHRRPVELETGQRSDTEEGDLPPIANVEVLW